MIMFWLLTSIIGLLLMWLVYTKCSKGQNYWEKRGVYCKRTSLASTLKFLFFSTKNTLETVVDMYRENKGHKYFGYVLLNSPVFVLRDPEIINQILIKDFVYFQDRNLPMNEEIMNSNLSNITGDKWRVLRHRLTPTFTSGKMKIMFKQIKECSDECVSFIKSKNGTDLETRDFLFRLMINVTGSTAFGIDVGAFNEDKDEQNEFLRLSKLFFTPTFSTQLKVALFLIMPKVINFLRIKIIDKRIDEFFHKLVQDVINHRKHHNERRNDFLQLMLDQQDKELTFVNTVNNLSHENKMNLNENKSTTVIDEVIIPEDFELLEHVTNLKFNNNTQVFTDNVIAGQAFLFISGGSDSTATILSFALHEMAVHKDIQRKLQTEIDNILSTQEFDYEAVRKMKYLEQFLNEVLRFRTTGSVLWRVCVQDYKMPGSGMIIEKDTTIQIPVTALHKDQQYFPDPDTFNPDRFDNMDSIPKGVFFPFGGGPRMCIAMRLAMLEMKVFIATLLKSCNVLRSEKTQIPLVMDSKSFTQQVKGGLWVKFEERLS